MPYDDSFELITFGIDPEVVVRSKATGHVQMAHRYFPAKVPGLRLYRDGTSLEVLSGPHTCKGLLLSELQDILRCAIIHAQFSTGKQITLHAEPYYKVSLASMRSAPPDVQRVGCQPAFDAYSDGGIKEVHFNPLRQRDRVTGFHIHMSEIPKEQHIVLAKCLDLTVGIPIAYVLDHPDEYKRRRFYGSAGEFRSPTYTDYEGRTIQGFEYRVLSSATMKHKHIMQLALTCTRLTVKHFKHVEKMLNVEVESSLQRALNMGEGIQELLTEFPGFTSLALIQCIKEESKGATLGTFIADQSDMQQGLGEELVKNKDVCVGELVGPPHWAFREELAIAA